jgi:hypothetical protein
MARRVAKGTVLNTSYSITYNTSSYSSISRNLVGQPPFSDTATNIGTIGDPLFLATGLTNGSSSVTNNFGVDPNYGLGMIQTWNATISRLFHKTWTVTAGYTGTRGSSLDLLRAPNRNPDGTLRIDGVQPFIWESSGGHSILSLGNVSIQRALAKGLRFGASYTIAKSMDNASSLGAGGAVVAQNDHDLGAEWALSSFDQRHQFTANMTYELPFGVGKKWLSNGGFVAALIGEWSMTMNFSAHSGRPSRRASSARRAAWPTARAGRCAPTTRAPSFTFGSDAAAVLQYGGLLGPPRSAPSARRRATSSSALAAMSRMRRSRATCASAGPRSSRCRSTRTTCSTPSSGRRSTRTSTRTRSGR